MAEAQQTTYNYWFNLYFYDFIPNDDIDNFTITNIKCYNSMSSDTPIFSSDITQYLNTTNNSCSISVESNYNLYDYQSDTDSLYFEITGKYGRSKPIVSQRFSIAKSSLENSADVIEKDSGENTEEPKKDGGSEIIGYETGGSGD